MEKELISLGLSEQEAKVYVFLLSTQRSLAGVIAKEVKLNRSVVYSVLESLMDKGLVTYVLINGTRNFYANNIDALHHFVEQKSKTFQELLPKLKMLKIKPSTAVHVEIYEGVNGGLAVMKDLIKTGKDYLGFGEDTSFQNIFGTLAEQYVRQLTEKNIKERLLVPEGQNVLVGKHTQVRYLPKKVSLPTITAIYGDKVAIAIFQKPYYAIIIQSKDLADSYTSLFEYMWGLAKK